MESYFVYILYSPQFDRFYIGQTQNVIKRIYKHNSGAVKSTKAYRPWEVVYTETFDVRDLAVQREMQLKSWKSKSKLKELAESYL